ncbi:MAG: GatB/YqeY domain-containing protein [Clostridiales bacterium]|nr:GatB/YqeY domain-containing protein [Clostridiales bacterium]
MDRESLISEIKNAMRAHDKQRVSVLRLVKSEVDALEKESRRDAAEAEVVSALKKVLKQTAETLEGSIKAGTDEARTASLREKVAILEGYLPTQVTGEELAAIVDRILAEEGVSDKREMGRVIGLVGQVTGGNCDKAEVARIVAARLG